VGFRVSLVREKDGPGRKAVTDYRGGGGRRERRERKGKGGRMGKGGGRSRVHPC